MVQEDNNEALPQARPRFSWRVIPIFAITGIVIYAVFTSLSEPEQILEALKTARWKWLALAIATLVALFAAISHRFRLVVRSLGYEITLFESFDAIIATYPFAVITPSKASDLLRAVALRDKISAIECSSAVVAERLIDVQAVCVLGILGCILGSLWGWLLVPLGLLLGIWLAVVLVLRSTDWLVGLPVVNRFETKVRRLLSALHSLRENPGTLAKVFATSLFVWSANILTVYLLTRVFDAGVAPEHVIAFWPLALIIGMLPLTLAGVGTRDGAFVFFVASVAPGIVEAPILLATLFYWVLGFLAPAAVGIPFMLRHAYRTSTTGEDVSP